MIIRTINEFTDLVPTAAGVDDFKDISPYLKSADIWLQIHVLGVNLYNVVDDSVENSDATDESLLLLCRNVVANHAYWDAIPFLDVVHTNKGFGVIQNQNTAPASKERVERLRNQCLLRRDSEVENLIDYLERNNQYHEIWKASPAYSILSDCLISTARELAIYAQWTGNRKEFLALRPKIIQFTISHLEPLFSKDYIEELIEKQRSNSMEGDDSRVSMLLKQALGSLVTENIDAAKHIANDALRYIDKYPESFETYMNSAEYAARVSANFDNTAENSIFSSIH